MLQFDSESRVARRSRDTGVLWWKFWTPKTIKLLKSFNNFALFVSQRHMHYRPTVPCLQTDQKFSLVVAHHWHAIQRMNSILFPLSNLAYSFCSAIARDCPIDRCMRSCHSDYLFHSFYSGDWRRFLSVKLLYNIQDYLDTNLNARLIGLDNSLMFHVLFWKNRIALEAPKNYIRVMGDLNYSWGNRNIYVDPERYIIAHGGHFVSDFMLDSFSSPHVSQNFCSAFFQSKMFPFFDSWHSSFENVTTIWTILLILANAALFPDFVHQEFEYSFHASDRCRACNNVCNGITSLECIFPKSQQQSKSRILLNSFRRGMHSSAGALEFLLILQEGKAAVVVKFTTSKDIDECSRWL